MFQWVGGIFALVIVAGGLSGGIAWIRADAAGDAVARERQRVAFQNERLQKEEEKRTAGIVASGQQDAMAEDEALAARDREIEAANTKIADLERINETCGTLSLEAVRELNRSR